MSEHAKLSPSSSSRWLECPSSIKLSEGVSLADNEAAKLGRDLHYTAESNIYALTSNNSDDFKFNEQTRTYEKYIADLAEEYDFQLEVKLEQKNYSGAYPCFGTADAIVFHDNGLIVADLKTGFFPVEPENNTQLLIYAWLASEKFKKHVHQLVIVQRGIVKVWTLPSQQPIKLIRKKVQNVQLFLDKDKELFSVGEHCRYCPAKFKCGAFAKSVLPSAELLPPIDKIDKADFAKFYACAEYLSEYAKNIKDKIEISMLDKGEKVPGLKIIRGRGRRVWTHDEEYIKSELDQAGYHPDDYTEEKLLPVTKIERLDEGKEFVSNYTTYIAGKYKVVPVGEKGEPIEILKGDILDEINDI